MKKGIFYIILSMIFFSTLNAQTATVPIVKLPEVPKPVVPSFPNQHFGSPRSNIHSPNNPHDPTTTTNIQQRNAAIMREVEEHEYFMGEIRRQNDIQMLINDGFPMQSDSEGTASYYKAFNEINNMLEGKTPLSVGRAVFLAENAYYDNTYEYAEFQDFIKRSVDFCNLKIEDEKLDKTNNLVKNMMLFRFMSDTLSLRDKTTKKKLFHYPAKYNYEDYDSQISFDSHFVTQLINTGKGQCHSMPLYYLILAEEMEAEAYLSLSPKHSFVKIQDEEDNWHNIELTCRAMLSDAHYINNSYIKAEALQNKLYLEPLDKTNTIAEMLIELARGYYHKYGLDDFYLKCADTAAQYLKNDLDAKLLRSAYQTRLTLTIGHLLGAPNPDVMKQMSPEAYKHFELMQAQYKQIDDMGYEELPDRVYANWLTHLEKERLKANKLPSIFINIPKEGR